MKNIWGVIILTDLSSESWLQDVTVEPIGLALLINFPKAFPLPRIDKENLLPAYILFNDL